MKAMKVLANSRVQISIICIGLLLQVSCTKKYAQINTDRKTIATIGAAELPFLFARAEKEATPSIWNYQIAQNLFADQYAQYIANVATYFPSDRLVIRMDWVGAAFNPIYTDVVPQLQSIFAAADNTTAEHAVADILWVEALHRVTDYWGPIPYSHAGEP